MSLPAWLDGAVFYQIYPQSFFDTNADGIGDLPGISRKLDYLQDLGVNALWLNPCFVSPFEDAGYDVSDYYTVAPRYGTNEDLKSLFQEAARRGIRVFLDLVPGHTSVQHPWFIESCRHAPNKYSDWYIWTDGVWSHVPPDLQVVRGYAERDGNYVTNFFYCQPALNYGFAAPDPSRSWEQPVDAPGPRAVREEIRRIMGYWLDLGAAGFRVDMAGSLVKRDPGGRATAEFWRGIRAWLDRDYPDAALVAEWSNPTVAIPAGFHMDFYMGWGAPGYAALFRKRDEDPYGCSFFDRSGRGDIREFLDPYLERLKKTEGLGYLAIPSGNHDINPRLGKGRDADDIALIFLFLLTMPGTPFIYYGDEIGMRGVDSLASKEGGFGRTGCRTPMQWDDTANAGFSSAPADRLYLPVEPGPGRPNVAGQQRDPGSLLNRVRRLLALRKSHPALQAGGGFAPIHAEGGGLPFVYRRFRADEEIVVALNPAQRPAEVMLPGGIMGAPPEVLYGAEGAFTRAGEGWLLRLPGVSGGVYRI
ncbi:MAG: alpha-amylase family glycosyl hydrolase [Patescibacteria group bacterium]